MSLRFFTTIIMAAIMFALPSFPASADEGGLVPLKTDTSLHAVYHMGDESSDRVRVQAVFLAGEADLTGPEGLSHYFEHLMYLGADKAIDFGFHGRTGNAWVNGMITVYYNDGARSELNDMFAFVRNLLEPPRLPERFMLEERNVVQREYDLRVSESPDRKMWDAARRLLYGDNGAGRSVIGTRASIDALTIESGLAFHERCYHPANMVLVVTGAISREATRNIVERQFGHLDVGNRCEQNWRDAFPDRPMADGKIKYSDRYVVRDAMKLHSLAQWTSGKGKRHDFYTLLMLRELLASTLEGGMAKPLRIDNFVLSGYDVWLQNPLNESIEFWFQGTPDEGIETGFALEKTKQAVQAIAADGIPEKSIERIRKRFLRAARRNVDDITYQLNRANLLLSIGVKPDSAQEHIAGFEAVTKVDLDGALTAIAQFDRLVEISLEPETSQ